MTRAEALRRLHTIIHGIDLDECESDDGWWENSHGVRFGVEKKRQLEALIEDLTPLL